jgi:hypothetical protein
MGNFLVLNPVVMNSTVGAQPPAKPHRGGLLRRWGINRGGTGGHGELPDPQSCRHELDGWSPASREPHRGVFFAGGGSTMEELEGMENFQILILNPVVTELHG